MDLDGLRQDAGSRRRDLGRARGIGIAFPPCVSDGRHVIDIHAQPQPRRTYDPWAGGAIQTHSPVNVASPSPPRERPRLGALFSGPNPEWGDRRDVNEVLVGGQKGQVMVDAELREQRIDSGDLNTCPPTSTPQRGCLYVIAPIGAEQRHVSKA